MDVFQYTESNYNYYPRTAIELCELSYDSQEAIGSAVSAKTNLSVVWGPVQLTRWDGIAYTLMFVASNAATGEYWVVIRGTNFDSLSSWLDQDLDVGSAKPIKELPGMPQSVPSTALISQGTFNGMSDLIRLKDPTTNQSAVEFLNREKPQYLYVTGHSLGGTLSPPQFAYLNAILYGDRPVTNMALWSFAGLTPGGTGFNDYFNSILPNHQEFLWRIQNRLDVAPLLWYSLGDIERIYDFSPYYLKWGFLEKEALEDLFDDARRANIGYAQPQVGLAIAGHFDTEHTDSWALQALHQHHASTYKLLVKGVYDVS